MFQKGFFFDENAFLILHNSLLEGTLKERMSTKLTTLFLNANASVPCLIPKYNTPEMDNNTTRTTWYLKARDTDQEKTLFTFIV